MVTFDLKWNVDFHKILSKDTNNLHVNELIDAYDVHFDGSGGSICVVYAT